MTMRPNRTPTFFWQGVLILLPVVVMAVLGLTAILRDKAAVEKEARQRAHEILQEIAPGLAERFGLNLGRFDSMANEWAEQQRVRIQGPSPNSSPSPMPQEVRALRSQAGYDDVYPEFTLPKWQAIFPDVRPEVALPNRLLFTADGTLPWPPGYDVPPRPPRWLLALTPPQRAAWDALCRAPPSGASSGDLDAAARRFLETDPPEEARANAEFLGFVDELPTAPPMESANALSCFAQSHQGALAESGLPLAALATARALVLQAQAGQFAPSWADLRDIVLLAPSLLTPTLLEKARPLAASSKDPKIQEWLDALATQWAVEERLRELGKGLREAVKWPGLASTSCWISALDDRWFCLLNPSRLTLDSYGRARPDANRAEGLDARFYPQAAVRDCFAQAVRETAVTLPDYFRLEAQLEGEHMSSGGRPHSEPTLAEAPGRLKIPVALPSGWVDDEGELDSTFNRENGPRPPRILPRPRIINTNKSFARLFFGESQPYPVNRLYRGDFAYQEVESLPCQPRLTITLSLSDPALLFAHQRQRTLLYGGVIGVSFLAALAGLIAARRAFERQLRLNELKSNFVSSVSHELRAPIASVRLMAESLERGKIAGEQKQRDYFRFIGQECRRLSSLIENVLDFSRIEQGRKQFDFEPTDLVALARQTVQLMRTYGDERQITLALAIPDSQVAILGTQPVLDGKAIQQALVNLIDNAMKHSPQGGTVEVGLEAHTGEAPGTGVSRVCLWVEDHGEGIPAGEQGKIFERFYRRGSELRRETQGVGIGLSIVKHLVEAHGGSVRVRSAPGQGSRFTIDIPLSGTPPPAIHP